MRLILAGLAAVLTLQAAAFAQDDAPIANPPPSDGAIVVPGRVDRPVPTPPGDPRSAAQRMRDVRAWDRCVSRIQSVTDSDPMRYQSESPEEYCSSRLGMQERTAIPVSRD